jgi:hypothetical protein
MYHWSYSAINIKTTKNDIETLNFNFVNLLLLNYGNKLNGQCKYIFKENIFKGTTLG